MQRDTEANRQFPAAREAMLTKARAGGLNGPAPLGYVNRRVDGETTVEIDPVTAPLVREAFRMATRKRTSLRQIGTAMADKGLVSRHGLALSATALWRILTNPFYAGYVHYQDELVAGKHKLLVSRTVFDLAQRQMALRRRNASPRMNY